MFAYRFRIYPNKRQEELILKTFGCCRFVYNYYLTKRIDLYKETNNSICYMGTFKVPAKSISISIGLFKEILVDTITLFEKMEKGEK